MNGRARQDIEATLMQYHRSKEAAGAVNAVKSRTIDLLPVVVRVAEIVREIDLSERLDDLMLRLDLGVPADLLDIARVCRATLTRTEYFLLKRGGLASLDTLAKANIADIAQHLGDDKRRAKAIRQRVREAKKQARQAA